MIAAWAAIGVTAALGILFAAFRLENRRFKVTQTAIRHRKIQKPFRVVQVSDLHDRAFGKEQSKLLSAIQSAKPDFIVVTGDLFNRHNQNATKNALAFAERVVSIAPTYFIEGNHECSLGDVGERDIKAVEGFGVRVLRNACVDRSECRLIGLKQHAEPEVLKNLMDPNRFNLVLAHRPERFPLYAGVGADVVLSGHAHGGQIRLFNRGIYAPQQGLFPKFTTGLYRIGASTMYLSRGLGNTIVTPRIFNTPELNVLDFEPVRGE